MSPPPKNEAMLKPCLYYYKIINQHYKVDGIDPFAGFYGASLVILRGSNKKGFMVPPGFHLI